MPHRENQLIVFNILLHGAPGSGKKTFLNWLVQNGNLLDANFLKTIELERKQLISQVNRHMRKLKELPRLLKQNLDELIQKNQFEEAETYFEIAGYRIQELCKSYDHEINRSIEKSVNKLQNSKFNAGASVSNSFSSVDIVGSSPNMIYRIYYINTPPPDLIELNTFLLSIDGIIFLWDAQWERIEENSEVFEELLNNLPLNNRYPLVIALNKTDLPHTIRSEDTQRLLTEIQFEEKLQTTFFTDTIYSGITIFETVSTLGMNLKKVLMNCIRMITNQKQTEIQEFQKLLFQEVRV